MKRLIDETNEYKFTTNDIIKKKDEHFLLLFEKIILNYLMIDSSLIV
jgi:hypothetical protein